MGINHDIFSSGAVNFSSRAMGTFINGASGGTGNPITAANHAYHAAVFFGTMANVGTLIVYGHTASTGDGTAVLGSIVSGSSNGQAVAFDFKADTLLNLGTAYTWYSAQVAVEAGGTWRGALVLMDYNSRSAGTTPAANGISALGTLYS